MSTTLSGEADRTRAAAASARHSRRRRVSYDAKKHATQVGIAGLALAALVYGTLGDAEWGRVLARLPLLLTGNGTGWPIAGGFLLNVFMSVVSMAIATVLGTIMAAGLLSSNGLVRVPAFLAMNFLRNAPWIVLLFSMLYLLPFQVSMFGITVSFPPVVKAIIGLSLPTAANLAEVVRGAVQSIHAGQWESARSLGYSTSAIYARVILPQALRRMIPGYMNLYALLMIATALATVTGVQEVITLLRTSLAMESEGVLIYFYLAVIFMFFAYCYPIALLARRIERNAKGDAI